MKRFYFLFTAVMGAAFVSGVAWAMCSILVSRDPAQVVGGVGLLSVAAVSGTGAFLLYLVRPGIAPSVSGPIGANGPNGANGANGLLGSIIHVRSRNAHEETPLLSCELDGEYESIVLATGDDTPPKVVFVEWSPPSPASPASPFESGESVESVAV
jgi:hypothetical protein